MRKNEPINVVLAADDKYSMPLAVAACSLAANLSSDRSLVLNVVQHGISGRHRDMIEDSLAKCRQGVRVRWLDAPMQRFEGLPLTHHWISPLAFVRLLAAELLPSEVRKAIYLDCDVVVLDDVAELWDIAMGGKSLLGAQDLIGYVGDPSAGIKNYRELGIPPDRKYFNSGVLVLDLERFREKRLGERLLQYVTDYRDVIRASDQEALNAVLTDDWAELEYRWNWQITARIYRIGTHKMGWTPPETRKSIIHFHSNEKPWLPACDYPEKRWFFEYLDRTAWAGWRVPWVREVYGRAARPIGDARNALGRMRRRIFPAADREA